MSTYTKKSSIKISEELEKILQALTDIEATPILVGGCIRDTLLNLPIKDYDIEVFNIANIDTLQKCLSAFGEVNFVGKSFGVLKLNTKNDEYDFALPRYEKKVGAGYKGFEVTTDAFMSFKEATFRRDFTINAIGYDYKSKKILDHHNAIEDLKNKILKYVDKNSFAEDPLRVYRAVQFASRFEFTLEKNSFNLCKKMVEQGELEELSRARIFEEFKKLLLKSSRPSIAFNLMKELNILKYFPELDALIECIQDELYHPEGDVWIHTLMVIDEMAKLKTGDNKRDLILMFAALCHDFGKPFCTKIINNRVTSHKHETLGVNPTISFLEKLTDEKKLIEKVVSLVQNHLAPFQLYKDKSSIKAIKRLSMKCNIEDLCIVSLADCKGRNIDKKSVCDDAVFWLLENAKNMNISSEAIKPLVQGRDLLALGLVASKEFKDILSFALNLQIDENLEKDEIVKRVKKRFIDC